MFQFCSVTAVWWEWWRVLAATQADRILVSSGGHITPPRNTSHKHPVYDLSRWGGHAPAGRRVEKV